MKKWIYFYITVGDGITYGKSLKAVNFSQAVTDAHNLCHFMGVTLVGVIPAYLLLTKARCEFKL